MAFSISYIYQITDKYTRPLKKIQGATTKFRSSMKKTSMSVSKFAGKMGSLQTMAGTVATTIGGKAMLDKFTGFEKSMNKLESVTFATADQMSQMREVAKDLGARTQFTAAQAAQGMTFLAMAGLDTSQVLEAIPGALNLAAAGSMDLGQAADIATNVLGQMGFSIKELARVNDVLAIAQSKANFNIFELFDAMRPVATTAKNLGISLEELTGLLGVMANAGEKGSIAGTLLRNALMSIAAPAQGQIKLYRQLGIDLKDFTDKAGRINNLQGLVGVIEQLQAESKITVGQLQKLYGERGFRAMQILAAGGAESIDKLTSSVTGVAGAAQRAADIQMKGLPGVIMSLASAFEAVNTAIFESGLSDLLVKVGSKITNIARSTSKTNPTLLKVAGILGLLVVVVTPLIALLGMLGGIAAGIAALFGTAVGPVMAVAVAISAVVASVVTLLSYKERLGEFFKKYFGGGKGLLGNLMDRRPGITPLPAQSLGVQEAAAQNSANTLNGNINVNAPAGVVKSTNMSTTAPGNLGMNLVGVQ